MAGERDQMIPERFHPPERVLHPEIGENERKIIRGGRGPDFPETERAEALKFLVHFVADLHQPLHNGNGLDSGANDQLLTDLDIPLVKLLHGEQSFKYIKPICAGDTLSVESTITDIYDKKGGKLEFVVKDSRVTNQKVELVAEMRTVLVVRH